jgi:hypothetical protein
VEKEHRDGTGRVEKGSLEFETAIEGEETVFFETERSRDV